MAQVTSLIQELSAWWGDFSPTDFLRRRVVLRLPRSGSHGHSHWTKNAGVSASVSSSERLWHRNTLHRIMLFGISEIRSWNQGPKEIAFGFQYHRARCFQLFKPTQVCTNQRTKRGFKSDCGSKLGLKIVTHPASSGRGVMAISFGSATHGQNLALASTYKSSNPSEVFPLRRGHGP